MSEADLISAWEVGDFLVYTETWPSEIALSAQAGVRAPQPADKRRMVLRVHVLCVWEEWESAYRPCISEQATGQLRDPEFCETSGYWK